MISGGLTCAAFNWLLRNILEQTFVFVSVFFYWDFLVLASFISSFFKYLNYISSICFQICLIISLDFFFCPESWNCSVGKSRGRRCSGWLVQTECALRCWMSWCFATQVCQCLSNYSCVQSLDSILFRGILDRSKNTFSFLLNILFSFILFFF